MSASKGYESAGDRGQRGDRHRSGRGLDHDRRHDPARPQRGLGLARRGESRRRLRQDRGRRALAAAGHHRPQGPRRLRRRSSRRSSRRSRPRASCCATIAEACPNADLATTTSSLSIAEIADAAGIAGQALRPPRLQPGAADEAGRGLLPRRRRRGARERALAWCAALGKTAVEVPDQAGFVVNRLLFPYLFDAVRLMERTGMEAGEVDTCMKLGAGHPMGPLALLDFVGLDVAEAIGDALYADSDEPTHKPPGLMVEMVGEGKLGPQERRRLLQLRLEAGVSAESGGVTSCSDRPCRRTGP